MLRKEAVSRTLLEVLHRLMGLPGLREHRLVGGTALALQIGHRISVDIDLFSSHTSDYQAIERGILEEFGADAKIVHYIQSPFGRGIAFSILGIKTDVLDWKMPFQFPFLETEGIRMARKAEIAAMKLAIVTSPPEWIRYEKKDFVDLAFLLKEFTLRELIQFYAGQDPDVLFPERLVIEALQCAELADKKPYPQMLVGMDWASIKAAIQEAIGQFLK